jgi:hypothetical protein
MPKFADATATAAVAWSAVVTANAASATKKAYPVSDAGTSVVSTAWSVSKGYLYLDSQAAAAGTTATLAATGRAFGILGQGTASMPAAASPFAWNAITATSTPTMMLSLLP